MAYKPNWTTLANIPGGTSWSQVNTGIAHPIGTNWAGAAHCSQGDINATVTNFSAGVTATQSIVVAAVPPPVGPSANGTTFQWSLSIPNPQSADCFLELDISAFTRTFATGDTQVLQQQAVGVEIFSPGFDDFIVNYVTLINYDVSGGTNILNEISYDILTPAGDEDIGTLPYSGGTFRIEKYFDPDDERMHYRILINGVLQHEFIATAYADPSGLTSKLSNSFSINQDIVTTTDIGGAMTLTWSLKFGTTIVRTPISFLLRGGTPTVEVIPPPVVILGPPGGAGGEGVPHRLIWDTQFRRWRNDSEQPIAILTEPDTNLLLYAKPMTIDGVFGYAIVYETFAQDYDDGGWVASGSPPVSALAKLPIPLILQTCYSDQNAPNQPKNYNALTIDCNPNGQTLFPVLLFDDNNGTVAPVVPIPSSFTGNVRQKFQFKIPPNAVVSGSPPVGGSPPAPAEWGQEAYRCALQLLGQVTAAPEIYQSEVYYAILPDWRTVFDSYEVKFGADLKLIKQAYFDVTTQGNDPLTVSLYADGSESPYYSFTIPANPARFMTPLRVRFPERLCRIWRMTVTSAGSFRLWAPIGVDWKPLGVSGKGYQTSTLGGDPPQ